VLHNFLFVWLVERWSGEGPYEKRIGIEECFQIRFGRSWFNLL